jgi:hypothetical protein
MAANQTSNRRQQTGSKIQGAQPARRGSDYEESQGGYGAIGDVAQQASDYVSGSAAQMQECIRDHAGASVAVSLLAGFGIGLVIGHAISGSSGERRTWRDRIAAEGLGRRLMERFEAMIPDAISEHFGK